jgi:hypothetical protein
VSRHEQVWKGAQEMTLTAPCRSTPVPRLPRASGETYKIIAVYENPTSDKIDAMAGLSCCIRETNFA